MATSSSRGSGRGLRALLHDVLPAGDERTILAGTGQNALGLAVTVLATFGASVLIGRALGKAAFGVVTLTTQAAFVLAAGARFGMDMAAVRRVAIDVGRGERDRVRAVVARAALICLVASVVVGGAVYLFAGRLAGIFVADLPEAGTAAFRAAGIAIPFAALVQVFLGGTRGLKVMRPTLLIFWMGQPLAWIGLMLLGWLASASIGVTALAYAASWALALFAAIAAWRRRTAGFGSLPAAPGEVRDLLRYGAPRAPASMLAQGLFYVELFVLARFASAADYGVYAAVVRVGQLLMLFLVSVNLMFSPFVADLHARGEREKLGRLFQRLTRWIVTATLPVLIVLVVAPGGVLRMFGPGFEGGRTALLILAAGQLVNVATGSVGFILIMVGRTGWDLVVYAGSVAFDVLVAVLLIPRMGLEGAAIAGAATLALSNLWRLALVRRFVGVQPFTRDELRLAVPTAAAGLAAWLVSRAFAHAPWGLHLTAVAAAALLVYAAVLVFAGLPAGERRALRRLLRGLRRQEPAGSASNE